jgi:hypothetical protein
MVLIASFSTPPRVELSGSFENFGMNLLLLMRFRGSAQGCQMVYFMTKNPNFGIF